MQVPNKKKIIHLAAMNLLDEQAAFGYFVCLIRRVPKVEKDRYECRLYCYI